MDRAADRCPGRDIDEARAVGHWVQRATVQAHAQASGAAGFAFLHQWIKACAPVQQAQGHSLAAFQVAGQQGAGAVPQVLAEQQGVAGFERVFDALCFEAVGEHPGVQ